MVTETDLELGDGRTMHAYDTGTHDEDGRLAVFWHHGSPNIGAPPEPLFSAADRLCIHWVSYDRPGYGGSTHRDIATPPAVLTLSGRGHAELRLDEVLRIPLWLRQVPKLLLLRPCHRELPTIVGSTEIENQCL